MHYTSVSVYFSFVSSLQLFVLASYACVLCGMRSGNGLRRGKVS